MCACATSSAYAHLHSAPSLTYTLLQIYTPECRRAVRTPPSWHHLRTTFTDLNIIEPDSDDGGILGKLCDGTMSRKNKFQLLSIIRREMCDFNANADHVSPATTVAMLRHRVVFRATNRVIPRAGRAGPSPRALRSQLDRPCFHRYYLEKKFIGKYGIDTFTLAITN